MHPLRSMFTLANLALILTLGGCITYSAHREGSSAEQFRNGYFAAYHGAAFNGYGGGWYR